MNRAVYHIILPAMMSVVFFLVALTPVEVLGCRTRGILAFLIALSSGMGALGAVIIALKKRIKGEDHSQWWIFSTLVLAIPVISLLTLA